MKTKAITIMLTLFLIGVLSIPVMAQTENADLNQELAAVRRATEKYHDEAEALADGYMPVSPHVPGMGAHYLKFMMAPGGPVPAIDGIFDPTEPEMLLYSLEEGGGPKLVGVEYLVASPGPPSPPPDGFTGTSDVWDFHPAMCHYADLYEEPQPDPALCPATSPGGAPLVLWHPDLGWTLHVWVWRANPNGIFEPFNPNVP